MRIARLAAILFLACACSAQSPDYNQPYRPQVHFSPREHWTNDPNGLVYFHGEYHLFFQFNPFGDVWGHMSWGHAVSTDLAHWKELPVAIPEKDGEMIFTGSVVVDRNNSSGLCAAKSECLVAIYTGYRKTPAETRQNQNLAYSLDDGRTWTRYAQNPVIDLHMSDFRDPSVFWDDTANRWIMAVSLPLEHKIRFYSSPDLKAWAQLSDFGPAGDTNGDWECPDLLHLPAGSETDRMWALKVGLNPGAPQGGSGEQYFLGNFDGKQFTASTQAGAHGWTNYGKDDYCAIGFNGLPANAKPILIGWMNNWQYAAKLPTTPWRGQMSIPRQLSLVSDQAGLALQQEPLTGPIREARTEISQDPKSQLKIAFQSAPFELNLQFGETKEQVFGLRLYSDDHHWTEVGFDQAQKQFYIDRTKSGAEVSPEFLSKTVAPLASGRAFDVRLIVDRSSVEAFAQNGTIAMTDLIFPPSQNVRVEVFTAGGAPIAVKAESWKLKSIWK